jgi:hypothetical protein
MASSFFVSYRVEDDGMDGGHGTVIQHHTARRRSTDNQGIRLAVGVIGIFYGGVGHAAKVQPEFRVEQARVGVVSSDDDQ